MEEKRVEIEEHCGVRDNILRKVGTHYGLYCAVCGGWLRWYPKKEAEVLLSIRAPTMVSGKVGEKVE